MSRKKLFLIQKSSYILYILNIDILNKGKEVLQKTLFN